MGKEKKPSIYVDRGTIGSSDELDEYGVWVKSEPHDITSTSMDTGEIPRTDDTDFEIPDIDDLPDFNAFEDESRQSSVTNDDIDLPLMELDSDEDIESEEDSDSDVFDFGDLGGVGIEQVTEETDIEIPAENDNEAESDGGYEEVSMDDLLGAIDTEEEDSSEFSAEIGSEEDLFEDSEEDFSLPSLSDETEAGIDIDEELDLSLEVSKEQASIATVERNSAPDLSTQLLMKIAEELSSIRTELSSLKKEFSGIKVAAAAPEGKKGSLDGEDDEKIALTGDELNNILNTAEFTEEAGTDVTIDLSDNISLSDLENTEDILSLTSSDSLEEAPDLQSIDFESDELESIDIQSDELESIDIQSDESDSIELSAEDFESESSDESITIDSIDTDLEALDELNIIEESIPGFADEEVEALNEIGKKGVEPMTFAPAPEDSDYLAEDPMVEASIDESFDLEEVSMDLPETLSDDLIDLSDDSIDLSDDSVDLSGAIIDEPDLSAEIHDNPIEEPSLDDISLNLDISDLDTMELDTIEEDFSELDSVEIDSATDSQEGGDISLIPEGFEAELDSTELEPVELDSLDSDLIELDSTEMESVELDSLDSELMELDSTELESVDLEEPEDLVSVDLEPVDLESVDLESVDLESVDLEPVELESVDLEPVDLELEDFESEEIISDDPEPVFEEDEEIEEVEEEGILEEELEPLNISLTEELEEPAPVVKETIPNVQAGGKTSVIPVHIKHELKTVLSYMDQLLEALPDEKIEEFARSEYYDTYKKLFKELGLA
jgi:uncharacterized protein YjbI with pentapeptide repeats